MVDIATLGVRVTSQGVKETSRDLDKLTKDGERAEKQAEKLGTAWGAKLGRASLAGAAVLGAGLALVIRNTIASDRVQAQLAARIRSTGGAAGFSVAELNKMAKSLQDVTTFSDEAINEVQQLLLTFTQIKGEQFGKATEAVLDLSVALGTSLNAAAIQVGKALNDPVRGVVALADAGVQFSDSQRAVIKQLVETGKTAEAQKIILRELEIQMGASARAARNTLGGALSALKNSFDDALTGDTGGGGVKGLIAAINDLTRVLNSPETKEGFAVVAEGLVNIAKFGAETIAMLGGVSAAIGQSFKDLPEKSFQGLIYEQMRLEDLIKRGEAGGGIGGGPFEQRGAALERLKARYQEVLVLQNQMISQENAVAISAQKAGLAAQMGGSTGPLRRRGSAGIDAPVVIPEDSLKLIEKIKEEAAAYGLSRAALLEREKVKALSTASSLQERKAITESYNALILKVRAEESSTSAIQKATEADKERQEVMNQGRQALEGLTGLVRQNAAELAGPAAQAAKDYADELLNLVVVEGQLRQANLLTADSETQLAIARDQANATFQRRIDAINEQRTSAEMLIEDLMFENSLIGLSNLAREKEIALRYAGAAATEEQRDRIKELIAEQAKSRQVVEAMDQVRDSTRGLFSDLMDGSKSAKDAFKDFVDSILAGMAQIVARNLTEQLLGSMGSTDGGASGGWLQQLFGAFFSGGKGRAIGGPVSGGRLYEVNEKGAPELLQMRGKQYLLPGTDGRVAPMGEGGGVAAPVVNQNIYVQGTMDKRTSEQVQRDAFRKQQMAAAR